MPRRVVSCQLPPIKTCKNPNCASVAISYDGFCKSHAPSRRIKSYNSRPRCSSRWANPIGIELEMIHPESSSRLAQVARFACTDGSLPYGGAEIKLVQDASKITNIAADTAQRAGLAGAKVNRSCGFHVHMGLPNGIMSGLDRRNDANWSTSNARNRLWGLAMHFQEYFFDIVPKTRRTNSYCSQLTSSTNSLFSHYSWLSVSGRVPTVELRIHSGTVNPWKVKGWVEVAVRLREMVNAAILGTEGWDNLPSRKFVDYVEPGTLGSKYLLARERAGGKLVNFGF